MPEPLSMEVLANLVEMMRTGVDGAILLSDDNEEARFYERCAHEQARVIPALAFALPLLEDMERRGLQGVVATVRGSRAPAHLPNAFQPSLGDVISLLFASETCNQVIAEICGRAWFNACERELGSVRHRCVCTARALGMIRDLCADQQAQHPPSLDPSTAINWPAFEIDWASLNPALMAEGMPEQALHQIRTMRPGPSLRSDLLHVDGAEAITVLAMAIRRYRPRGIAPANQIDRQNLVSMLRVAFQLHDFEDDEVFWQMRRWERQNPRYPLLSRWRHLDSLGVALDQRYWENDLTALLALLKPNEIMAVYQIDLDEFKPLNDALGHVVGDDAIRLYCRTVNHILGDVGEVYRRGGDEVVAIAPAVTETVAHELGEQLRRQIESAFRHWPAACGLEQTPTASIGLVLAPAGTTGVRIKELVDHAQRRAKQEGRNRVVVLRAE